MGLTFPEFIILLGISAILITISAALYSQIFAQQRHLDDKAEIVNLTGQLSVLRQSTSICSCNLSRLSYFDTEALSQFSGHVPALQIWDPACANATSTLIATESSGLAPGRSLKARSIDFTDLAKVTDTIYKIDLRVPLIGQDGAAKALELKNILVYTAADPITEPTSRHRKIVGCVPFTGPGEHLVLADQRAKGTPGGHCQVMQWNRRVFTRVLMDDYGVVSAKRNAEGFFTEPASIADIELKRGTYSCEITAPVHYAASNMQARLVDASTGETLITGTSEASGGVKPSVMRSLVKGRFTLSSSGRVRLESFISPSRTADLNTLNNCLGVPAQSGAAEVYSTFDCWRLP